MNCKEAQRLLVPYIGGDLTAKEEAAFVNHVRHCSECMEELEVYQTVFVGIRQLDGEDTVVNYKTLVEDSLKRSEEDAIDQWFMASYHVLLWLSSTAVVLYLMIRWFIL